MSNKNTGQSIMESTPQTTQAKAKSAKRVPRKNASVDNVSPSSSSVSQNQASAPPVPAFVANVESHPVVASLPSVNSAVVVPTAQGVSSSVSQDNSPTTTLVQDFESLYTQVQTWRDLTSQFMRTLQRLQKRVTRTLREAGRRRHRRPESSENREKRPTIFTTPVSLKDELCAWLEKPKGTLMTPADVTRAFSAYVKKNQLKDVDKGHTIHPDASMRKVLGIKDGETLTYRNIQTYLYRLYNLPHSKSASAVSGSR